MQMRTNLRMIAAATLVLAACSSSSSSSNTDASTTTASAVDSSTVAPTTTAAADSGVAKTVEDHLSGVHNMQGVTVTQDDQGRIVISTQTAAGNTGDGVLTCNNAMMVAGNVAVVQPP